LSSKFIKRKKKIKLDNFLSNKLSKFKGVYR
jgi:hypothetical protein